MSTRVAATRGSSKDQAVAARANIICRGIGGRVPTGVNFDHWRCICQAGLMDKATLGRTSCIPAKRSSPCW
eukprot:2058232-Amphidinium_carterae.1